MYFAQINIVFYFILFFRKFLLHPKFIVQAISEASVKLNKGLKFANNTYNALQEGQ
jgi:hypothetical protein